MALGVDLFGMAADGTVMWHWMSRFWEGRDVLKLVAPAPADPWPAWAGPITREQVEILREQSGGRQCEADFRASQRQFGVKLVRAYSSAGADGPAEWLEVEGDSVIISHPQHGLLTLEPGIWRIVRQREFDPSSQPRVRLD